MKYFFSIALICLYCREMQAQKPAAEYNLSDSAFNVGSIYKGCKLLYNQPGGPRLRPECLPCLDSFAFFMLKHPEIVIAINNYSDQRGADQFNLKSTQMRAENIKNYLVSKGVRESNLAAVGYGELFPFLAQEEINAETDPAKRDELYLQNIRTEFEIICIRPGQFSLNDTSFSAGKSMLLPVQFQPDKSVIDTASFHLLDSLAAFLLVHPGITIEVSTHSDIQSGDQYGQCLTCKRAQTVCDYLISKGVAPRQVVAKGYGDAKIIVNNILIQKVPGEPGKQELRKINRRTEIRILSAG